MRSSDCRVDENSSTRCPCLCSSFSSYTKNSVFVDHSRSSSSVRSSESAPTSSAMRRILLSHYRMMAVLDLSIGSIFSISAVSDCCESDSLSFSLSVSSSAPVIALLRFFYFFFLFNSSAKNSMGFSSNIPKFSPVSIEFSLIFIFLQ